MKHTNKLSAVKSMQVDTATDDEPMPLATRMLMNGLSEDADDDVIMSSV